MSNVIPLDYPDAVAMATAALEADELVVVPTDTVYGVVSAIRSTAIARIYAVKSRPVDRPIPVLLAYPEAAEQVVSDFPAWARQLAEAFWPGPLTLVLPRHADLPENLSPWPTVGVRMPDHNEVREVIAAAGGAIASTSANLSSQPPACTVHTAIDYLADAIALYLDGGPCPGSVPSTVVAMEQDELQVLRKGPIGASVLREVLQLS